MRPCDLLIRTEHICCFFKLTPWDRSLSAFCVHKHMESNDSSFDEKEMTKSHVCFGKMPPLSQNYMRTYFSKDNDSKSRP